MTILLSLVLFFLLSHSAFHKQDGGDNDQKNGGDHADGNYNIFPACKSGQGNMACRSNIGKRLPWCNSSLDDTECKYTSGWLNSGCLKFIEQGISGVSPQDIVGANKEDHLVLNVLVGEVSDQPVPQ